MLSLPEETWSVEFELIFHPEAWIPKTWAGTDLKVQLQEPVVLKDVDGSDWHLLQGDSDVTVKVRLWATTPTPAPPGIPA